ncbi:cation transport ATPase [Sinorhizobium fredii]
MDVPIALAVTLSYCMSLYETIGHGEHAWFDASVTLLFFLLIGRTLDHMMRGRLFQGGVMVKDGSAMERLAGIDTVLLDKTGTLTIGEPRLVNQNEISPDALATAAALAAHSRHPIAVALHHVAGSFLEGDISEIPGSGIQARTPDGVYRLGSRSFASGGSGVSGGLPEAILSLDGRELACFRFEDRLRPAARESVAALHKLGLRPAFFPATGSQSWRRSAAGSEY